jgi:hypothetical protein
MMAYDLGMVHLQRLRLYFCLFIQHPSVYTVWVTFGWVEFLESEFFRNETLHIFLTVDSIVFYLRSLVAVVCSNTKWQSRQILRIEAIENDTHLDRSHREWHSFNFGIKTVKTMVVHSKLNLVDFQFVYLEFHFLLQKQKELKRLLLESSI